MRVALRISILALALLVLAAAVVFPAKVRSGRGNELHPWLSSGWCSAPGDCEAVHLWATIVEPPPNAGGVGPNTPLVIESGTEAYWCDDLLADAVFVTCRNSCSITSTLTPCPRGPDLRRPWLLVQKVKQ